MLPQHNSSTPEAEGSVVPAVELNNKIVFVIGRVAYVEGGVRRKGLERVQMCMDVSAGA